MTLYNPTLDNVNLTNKERERLEQLALTAEDPLYENMSASQRALHDNPKSSVENTDLLTKMNTELAGVQKAVSNIVESYNSNPTYASFGGFEGLANMISFRQKGADSIAKEITEKTGMDKSQVTGLSKLIRQYQEEYDIPLHIAGAAVYSSLEPTKGIGFNRQTFSVGNDEFGSQTSIDDHVKTAIKDYKRHERDFNLDVNNVADFTNYVDTYNSLFKGTYTNIQNQQDSYNKLRDISDNNPYKFFAKNSLESRIQKSLDQYNKAANNVGSYMEGLYKDLNIRFPKQEKPKHVFDEEPKMNKKLNDIALGMAGLSEDFLIQPKDNFKRQTQNTMSGSDAINRALLDKGVLPEELDTLNQYERTNLLNAFNNGSISLEGQPSSSGSVPNTNNTVDLLDKALLDHGVLPENLKNLSAQDKTNMMNYFQHKNDPILKDRANNSNTDNSNANNIKRLYHYFYGNE